MRPEQATRQDLNPPCIVSVNEGRKISSLQKPYLVQNKAPGATANSTSASSRGNLLLAWRTVQDSGIVKPNKHKNKIKDKDAGMRLGKCCHILPHPEGVSVSKDDSATAKPMQLGQIDATITAKDKAADLNIFSKRASGVIKAAQKSTETRMRENEGDAVVKENIGEIKKRKMVLRELRECLVVTSGHGTKEEVGDVVKMIAKVANEQTVCTFRG